MRIALTASLAILFFSAHAKACFCSGGGCPGLGSKAYPVFVGTVLSVTDLPSTGEFRHLGSRKARIEIDESFGGTATDTREIDVLTGSGGGDCGVPFKVGERFLVKASVSDDGSVQAGICGGTKRIDQAVAELRLLRQTRSGERIPSLIGMIVQIDRNFEGLFGTSPHKPLWNTPVRLKLKGQTYATVSDSEGIYEFYGLPAGSYELAPELQPGMTLSWFIDSDETRRPLEIGRGCQMQDIEVFAKGSIQGRVLDSSKQPLAQALVYILPADRQSIPNERQLYWTSQGKEGLFKFVHIPPGNYVILVNPDDSSDPKFPYSRTFHPGVHDRESAAIITIHGGEQIPDADIHLKPRFEPRYVKVHVTWIDGRLIRDLAFVEAKGTEHPSAMAGTRQPDSKASVIDLMILPNESYEIEAQLICVYEDEHSMGPGKTLRTNTVTLGARDQITEISLTIPAKSCPEVPGKKTVTENRPE
jgi:hypothetical protein